MNSAFVMDLFSPAVGLPRLREIVGQRKVVLLWSWLILPTIAASILYLNYWPRKTIMPGGLGLFLLLIVDPVALVAYYVIWLRPLLSHLKQAWGNLGRGGMYGAPLLLFVVLMPALLMSAMLAYSFYPTPLFQRTVVGIDWLLPLVVLVFAVVVASYPLANGPFLVASFSPLVGLQGVGYLVTGRPFKAVLRLAVGGIIVACTALLLQATEAYTYRSSLAPHHIIKIGVYLLGIAYFAIWFLDMADLTPVREEEALTSDKVEDVASS